MNRTSKNLWRKFHLSLTSNHSDRKSNVDPTEFQKNVSMRAAGIKQYMHSTHKLGLDQGKERLFGSIQEENIYKEDVTSKGGKRIITAQAPMNNITGGYEDILQKELMNPKPVNHRMVMMSHVPITNYN